MIIDLTYKPTMSESMTRELPQVIVRPKGFPAPPCRDYVLDVTSHDPEGCSLSPFRLAPIGGGFRNVENAWQYSKVYRKLGHIGEDGLPNDAWHHWRDEAKTYRNANRYPAGRGVKPEYIYWRARLLSYTTARKLLYLPLYSNAVVDTPLFQELQDCYRRGQKIMLIDFDARDTPTNDWRYLINDANGKFGHGNVLAMMLEYGPDFATRILV